jgi:hypothetical protein
MARWQFCNVLHPGSESRELWSFHASGGTFKPSHHEIRLPAESLTAKVVAKDWQHLYQKKLNVAWLPTDKVFLKALQLPAADAAEAKAMIELQLEKISPIQPQQAVWSFELLPSTGGALRTVVVVVAERSYVEHFLGKLEEQGYAADRLESPLIDQLLATKVTGDGAWVYPGLGAQKKACLVAWWCGGVLHNVSLLQLPANTESGTYLRGQLTQMAWAGEMEGWLTSPPRWHLVADPETAVNWQPLLQSGEVPLAVISTLAPGDVAALTARRAASGPNLASLLPPEHAVRYRQQFIDRIWMRGVGAVLVLVLAATLIYLGALQVLKSKVDAVDKDFQARAASYTNAIKIKAEVQVLQDQVDLQFAALEVWKAAATLLPSELTLEGLTFNKGKLVTIFGSGPPESGPRASDYSEALSKAMHKDQTLFTKVSTPDQRNIPGQGLRWNLTMELKRNVTE